MSRLLTVLEQAYEAFNARDLARLRPLVHPQATWPNTLEDGSPLVGKEAVMGHFGRMFATMTPNIHVIEVIQETTIEALLAPLDRDAGLVTLTDGAPLALSWLGSVRGQRVRALGLEAFGQSGDLPDLYGKYRLDAEAVLDACADLLT